jgi:hypothetical protein
MIKKYYMFIYGFLMLSTTVLSQEGKFKALFMYNFTKYLEWPAEKQKGDFVIAVYGKSDITQELKIISGKKRVGSQPIVVKEINSSSNLSNCHIIYVPTNQSAKINEIKSKCSQKGTVLITDKPGLAKTVSGINYVKINGKQSFEINKTILEKQGIKINSSLLALGVLVQ